MNLYPYMILLLFSAIFTVPLAGRELLLNSGFEQPLNETGWQGRAFREINGTVERTQEQPYEGIFCVRMAGEGTGGWLELRNTPVPVPNHGKLDFSVFHRGGTARMNIHYFTKEKGKFVKIPMTKIFFRLYKSEKWRKYFLSMNIPAECAGKENLYIQLQFLYWGTPEPSEFALDSISLKYAEPAMEKRVIEIIQPQPLSPKEQGDFGPITPIRFKAEVKNGLIYRGGEPYFWLGEGEGLGGSSQRAATFGLWLARVLQNKFVSFYLDPYHFSVKESSGKLTIDFSPVRQHEYSIARESARYQLYNMWNTMTGVDRWVKPYLKIEKYPGMSELFMEGNHYRCIDLHSPKGQEYAGALAGSLYRYMKDADLFCMEGNRELGYMPSNERIFREFRNFARKKYGSLEEANRVWQTDYRNWELVIPSHLANLPAFTFFYRKQARDRVAGTPMHYDYLIFLQEDLTEALKTEKQLLRRWHNAPYATDIRGDIHWIDGYASSEPELLEKNGVRELALMHRAFLPYRHDGNPATNEIMAKKTAETLYAYNIFRTNSSVPVLNIECIVKNILSPLKPEESMQVNDIAKLHSKWKFRYDAEKTGEYFSPDLDDSGWDEIEVPGCWDQKKLADRKGNGWYRKSFVMPPEFQQDFLDGSRKFYLYGKGISQSGIVYFNGVRLGTVARWDTEYCFDVSTLLKFGQANQITVLSRGAENSSENGIRFYLHLLPQDMVNELKPFGEEQYVEMLWTYLMQGSSGVSVWDWNNTFRPYLPKLMEEINTFAPFVLPDARKRHGKVAFLHSWLSTRGIPHDRDGAVHYKTMNYFNSFVFNQLNPDVFLERTFLSITPEEYPVLVVPYVETVFSETYAHFKNYIIQGGTAIISTDSLTRTFTRYEATDIDAFARLNAKQIAPNITLKQQGRGKIIVISGEPEFPFLVKQLKPFMPRPEIAITSNAAGEHPFIEARICGDKSRKVLYLHNWGGCTHKLTVRIPEAFSGWSGRNVRGSFRKNGNTVSIDLPGSSVGVLLLEAPGTKALKIREVHPELAKVLARLTELDRDGDNSRPAVLFMGDMGRANYPAGRKLLPMITDALDKLGYETHTLPAAQWTPEKLKHFKLAVLIEDYSRPFFSLVASEAPFRSALLDYLKNGGALMVLNTTWPTLAGRNNSNRTLSAFAHEMGVSTSVNRQSAYDPANCNFGDPSQILSRNIADHAVTRGVKELQLSSCRPMGLKNNSKAVGLVFSNPTDEHVPNAPVIAVGEYGKGRLLLSADGSWVQPFRIEYGDNARFLMNVLEYLLRIEVPEKVKLDFAGNLFITQKQFEEIEQSR